MALKESFIALAAWWQETIREVFSRYEALGRPILDALHWAFNGMFDFLLAIAIIVSFVFMGMTVYTILINRKKEKEFIDEKYAPFVTIQIPTFNEAVAIRCAEACLNFEYPKDKYEILIGDDSNQEDVSQKLREFASKHELVKHIKRGSNEGFKPGNLNNMLKHSKGEIIVIFDSDFVPKKDFLKRIIQPFSQDKNIVAVQAKWSFINQNQNLISTLGSSILNGYHYVTLPFIKRFWDVCFLCGSAEAVRKDTLIKLGGWHNGNLTEDIEYSIRVINNGYKIKYLEELKCDSEVPHTAKDFYRQQMRWSYGVIFSFKRHFKNIISSKANKIKDRASLGIVGCGYFLTFLFFGLFVTGILSIITHRPEPIDLARFFSEFGRNVILTSGIIIANSVGTFKSQGYRSIPKSFLSLLLTCFSFGYVTVYYVNKGILKALFGKPMEWYMLKKRGNEDY